MGNIKIGYFADGPWSHKAFELLLNDDLISIEFICARYDTSDQKLKELSKNSNIDFIKHQNINSEEFLELVGGYKCDLFVSMSFNQIFKSKIINMTPNGLINCHAGKLPFYRGRNILNWVLINDESEFGITVHYVDESIDTGDVILQKTYTITDKDTYQTLLNKAYVECANVLYESIKLIQRGEVSVIKQSDIHPVGMYCSQRMQGDEIIDWGQTTRDIFNFVRAICHPGPGARTHVKGNEVVINRVEIIDNSPVYKGINGAIVGNDGVEFVVKTSDSIIRVCDYTYMGTLRIGDRLT